MFSLRSSIPWLFQYTHPVRGATGKLVESFADLLISIHAPREGCDEGGAFLRFRRSYFNPRTP